MQDKISKNECPNQNVQSEMYNSNKAQQNKWTKHKMTKSNSYLKIKTLQIIH